MAKRALSMEEDDVHLWQATFDRLVRRGIRASVLTTFGVIQVRGDLPDGESFFLHSHGDVWWLGVGGDEPSSAPYWHWMAPHLQGRPVSPDEGVRSFVQLYEKYLSDRHAALEADTTWWNLRHRPVLDGSLQENTGGLALSWKGASQSALERLKMTFDIRFPEDYLQFLKASDGAVGEVGPSFLELWSVKRVATENQFPSALGYGVLFGSDGDTGRYAFKTGPKTKIVEITSNARNRDEVARGYTLVDLLKSLLEQPTSHR